MSHAHDPGSADVVVRTPAGGLSNTASFSYHRNTGHQAVAANADRRTEIFALGADHHIYHNWQTSPGGGFQGWSIFSPSPQLVSDPGVGLNSDGRLESFATGGDGNLYHLWQTAPSSGWSGIFSLAHPPGVAIQGIPAVAGNADGRLEVLVRGGDGGLWHMWQIGDGGGWSAWSALSTPDGGLLVTDITSGRNSDGRLEVAGVAADGLVWHIWQLAANSAWSGWERLDGAAAAGTPVIASNHDGRLEVFYLASDSATFGHTWQISPGGSWSTVAPLAGAGVADPAIVSNQDGRLEVFGVDLSGNPYHEWQTSPNGPWSGGPPLAQDGLRISGGLWAAINPDGSLAVLGEHATTGSLWANRQTSAGSGWSTWVDMGGSFLPYS